MPGSFSAGRFDLELLRRLSLEFFLEKAGGGPR